VALLVIGLLSGEVFTLHKPHEYIDGDRDNKFSEEDVEWACWSNDDD